MTIDLSQFYSGGYFLIRPAPLKWIPQDHKLASIKIVSLSDEISPHFVIKWGVFEGFHQDVLDFGVPPEKLEALLAWCNKEWDEEPYKVFASTEAARQFIRRFDLPTENLHLVGVGIPHAFEEKLWNEPGTEKPMGVETLIEQHLLLEDGGQPIGFEVITYEYSDFAYSWLSAYTYARREIEEKYGIEPNAHGLIDTFEEAMTIYEWIEDTSEGRRGEPVPYDVALLVNYPLTLDS